jgi:hypothetical protein
VYWLRLSQPKKEANSPMSWLLFCALLAFYFLLNKSFLHHDFFGSFQEARCKDEVI